MYIEGNNFKNGLTVKFGNLEAVVLKYYNENKIRIRVPANSAGTVDVTITNPDGQVATLTNGFTYKESKCEITSLSATTGELIGGEIIIIYGKNFEEGLTVKFGNNTAKLLNYYDSNRIRVKVPAGTNPGSVDIIIENPSGKIATLSNGYVYKEIPVIAAPTIQAITSNGLLKNAITEAKANNIVYINGSDFQSSFVINIYDQSGNKIIDNLVPLNCYDSCKGRFRLPKTLNPGSYKISITNSDGQESNKIDFNIINS